MAFNDPVVRLGDYVEACLGKMLDAQKNRGAFQPYLGNSNVRWGAFDLQDLAVMRFEQQEEERYGLRDGDLVVCEGGEPGRCAIWQGEVPNMKIQKALHRIRVKSGLDNYFLYYWFLHAGKTGALEPYFTGTTIKHLTGKALAELKIPLPPIERQRGLAKVLRSLDDKIDLNRRINQTLEAMAQAIFNSWFVNFDPVKAKIAAIEQGQDPLRAAMRAISGKTDAELDQMLREHHDQLAATAALFPDAMEESESWEIPKGWEVSTIGEMVEIAGGATPDTKNESYWNPPEYFWTSPKDLSGAQSPVLLTTERKISTAGLSRIGSGLLPKGTLLMSSRAPIGYLAITQIPVAINQGYIAMLPGGKLPPLYLLMWCQQNMEEIKGQANGSTFMEISKKAFRPMLVINPGSVVLDRFIETVAPLFERLAEGVKASSQLAELRDTLLPKLLSGELRVPDAECSMEEV
ncbi:EcoKI restriction-modification system protein HsdS [Bordetella hinzii]|uniref:Restriction endonuclease subunit S n=3 Tax=Bordetella hinzii TaxID=103855 RepID=A0AAN1VEZ9_9BORD|nr:restriction endonuclease subunit S [Bordetella hinzii]AKQ58607.1 EcoKI restriction-modification system protein HsdS [Bordetella hinzii]AZW16093.1 restriction endonuclease subunit S [Bordetella hinzii]QET45344.1 restriction endonuclease subunit S [Bordetella hinzii]